MASSMAAETSSVLRAPPSLHILYYELGDGGGVLLADVMLNFLVKLLELPAMHAKRQQLAAQFFLYCQDGREEQHQQKRIQQQQYPCFSELN
ncbi:hypothetical protein VPH35_124682 [Triticum aestivum]|uniref:uncharacterized protein isoform X2 n=1 Tax=Triticum aestivum TaxID=4565 RepID=UPI001D018365|nr:uncharacterized protein LOC123148467 isoform X2 [Triticum aestivum]